MKDQASLQEPWTVGRLAMVWSLVVFHGIAIIVGMAALIHNTPNTTLESIFGNCCLSICGTLGILVTGKRFKDRDLLKFGGTKGKQQVTDGDPDVK